MKNKTGTEKNDLKKLCEMSSAEIDAYIKECAKKDKKELEAFIKKKSAEVLDERNIKKPL